MPEAAVDWDDANIKTLTTMWAAGRSASEIAAVIPRASRSGVLGKIMRLKLPPRDKGHASPGTGIRVRRVAPRPASSKVREQNWPHRRNPTNSLAEKLAIAEADRGLPAELEEPAIGSGIQLIDLTNSTCRYPFGHPSEENFFFCGADGADLQDRRPYCPFHTAKTRGVPVNSRRFDGSAMFAAGIKTSTRGAQHGT